MKDPFDAYKKWGIGKYYKLNDKKEIVECSIEEWGEYLEGEDRHIGKSFAEHDGHKIVISTIFLGMSHLGGMFETMAFMDSFGGDMIQERCETYEEALLQHEKVCLEVQDMLVKKLK